MAVGAPSAGAEILPDAVSSFYKGYVTKTRQVMESDFAVTVIAVGLLARI